MSAAAVIVLAVAAAAAAIALRWPFVGLLAYLWLDFMRPHDRWVELRDYRPMLVLGLVTVAATAWQRRDRLLDARWSLLPLAALTAVVALAAATSVDPLGSAEVLLQMAKLLVLVWAIHALVSDEAHLRALIWVLSLSLAVLAVGAVVQAIDHGLLWTFRPEAVIEGPPGLNDGAFRDSNDLARVLVLSLPLWWALAARGAPAWSRALAALGCVLVLSAIECTYSRGGFVAILAAVAVLSLSLRSWWRRAVALLAFAAALMALSPQPYLDHLATIAHPLADRSILGRLAVWQEGLQIGRDHLVGGQGPGTFRRGADSAEPVRRSPHNIFVELAAELGLAGVLVYAWMLIATLIRLHRVRRGTGGTTWLRPASIAIEAALIAYLTASLFLSEPFASPLFVLVGLSLALDTVGGGTWDEATARARVTGTEAGPTGARGSGE